VKYNVFFCFCKSNLSVVLPICADVLLSIDGIDRNDISVESVGGRVRRCRFRRRSLGL